MNLKGVSLLIIAVLLSSCQQQDHLTVTEKTIDELNNEVQIFFNSVNDINGVHVYNDKQQNMLILYLNASVVSQGDPAEDLKHFSVTPIEDTLQIAYESDLTANYDAEVDNQLYYEIQLDQDYDMLKLFHHDQEIAFGQISGNVE